MSFTTGARTAPHILTLDLLSGLGALSMNGLAELGLDPRRVVMVRAADVESALRTSADALACDVATENGAGAVSAVACAVTVAGQRDRERTQARDRCKDIVAKFIRERH